MTTMTQPVSILSIYGEVAIHIVLGEVSFHSTIEHVWSTSRQVLAPIPFNYPLQSTPGCLAWNK